MVNTKIRLIIFLAAKDGEALYSQQKTRLGAECGSDHELVIAEFKLKLKKVGKTTRPLRYNLNQIPYDYTVEVTDRFNGLDLIDRVPEELWTEVRDIVQEARIKTIPKKKKCKKAKWLSEEAGAGGPHPRCPAQSAAPDPSGQGSLPPWTDSVG